MTNAANEWLKKTTAECEVFDGRILWEMSSRISLSWTGLHFSFIHSKVSNLHLTIFNGLSFLFIYFQWPLILIFHSYFFHFQWSFIPIPPLSMALYSSIFKYFFLSIHPFSMVFHSHFSFINGLSFLFIHFQILFPFYSSIFNVLSFPFITIDHFYSLFSLHPLSQVITVRAEEVLIRNEI